MDQHFWAGVPPREAGERKHFYKDDIAWEGSGTEDDPWVMMSWDVKACTCDRPWRHGYPA